MAAVTLEKLTALEDTTLCVRPIQSSILFSEGLPEQVYRVPKRTELRCVRVSHWEGEHQTPDTDGDDYFWIQLVDPLPGSRLLNYFAYKRHWREQHPPMLDSKVVVSEEKKKDAARIIQSASAAALNESAKESEQKVKDLGPVIELPGRAFTRKRHLYEPVAWIDGKPLPFTWAEFTKNGQRVPQTEAIAFNIIKIATVLAFFRAEFDQPIEITSGYRDPVSNRAVSGAWDSRHMYGDAADWAPMRDGITLETWNVVRKHFKGGGLAISGVDGRPELGFFHTDGRGGGDPLNDTAGWSFWTYPRSPSWVHGR